VGMKHPESDEIILLEWVEVVLAVSYRILLS